MNMERKIRRMGAAVLAIWWLCGAAFAYDVTVGGQSLGIILKSEGAQVVGFTPVIVGGEEMYPAKEAGVELDDRLLKIGGKSVSSNREVAKVVEESGGEPLEVLIGRGEEEISLNICPQFCEESGEYRIGLYIRDANAGIGTLTFYDPATGHFAALGHRIEQIGKAENGDLGRVLAARVQYVESSREGEPGEKVGVFDEGSLKGEIGKNCSLGIYGSLDEEPENALYPEPVTVAGADEVKCGPATILTVLSGEEIEEFAIEIERVLPQRKADDKGMVIKIVDERLLAAAGGIVQGMSGSPIMQDGKLVGAVTHVFVNDGSSGYGCFAEWLLEEAMEL